MRIGISGGLILVALGLSACGGGGGGGTPAASKVESASESAPASAPERTIYSLPPAPLEASYTRFQDQGLALVDEISTFEYSSVEQLPVSGVATYQGITALHIGREASEAIDNLYDTSESDGYNVARNTIRTAELTSDVELNVDFSDDWIGGKLDNFRTDGNETLSGVVAIKDGSIDGGRFGATISGQISPDSDYEYQVYGNLAGGFKGQDAVATEGIIDGILTGTGEVLHLGGIFVGKQQ